MKGWLLIIVLVAASLLSSALALRLDLVDLRFEKLERLLRVLDRGLRTFLRRHVFGLRRQRFRWRSLGRQ